MAKSTDYPGDDYDLVAFFDCFHDMGDPNGAASHVLKTLRKKEVSDCKFIGYLHISLLSLIFSP